MSKNNGHVAPVATYDFSNLYHTETVEVKRGNVVIFTAVVREITHGEKSDAQAAMMANIDIPTEGSKVRRQAIMKEQLSKAMKSGVSAKVSLHEELAAIQSWTLKDAQGTEVPVCAEAWMALPYYLSSQIVSVIERLNPEIDEDFQG
jgi:hypothetical protein